MRIHRLVLSLPACALLGCALLGFALLSSCASQGVHCDGRLQPINPPRAAGATPPRAP